MNIGTKHALAIAALFAALPGCYEEKLASRPQDDRAGTPGGPGSSAASNPAVAASKAKFETTVRPLLRANCIGCHESKVRPFHSSASVDVAFDEIMAFHLVDFANPKGSRLYTRLGVDKHYCWGGDCVASSNAMLEAITAWAASGGAPQSSTAATPTRSEGPTTAIPENLTKGSPADMTLNASATELKFAMTTATGGPVTFGVNVEKFDAYSYRLFFPKVYAPAGTIISVKELRFKLNDTLRPDGSFALLDKKVTGEGDAKPIVLDDKTTMILLLENGPAGDRIAPSFASFAVQ
jgi:hypothetical protein